MAKKRRPYSGKEKLMPNYGWVQNTSKLSTVRDVVELVPEGGVSHNSLMWAIYEQRKKMGSLKKKWEWDARCRIKAICACGMAELDRDMQGYQLTELGRALRAAPKSSEDDDVLSPEEREIFQKGLLTNPPVIRTLQLLNENRKNGGGPMSKYDIGGRLGFVGDTGFTHFEAGFVAWNGKNFNDAEGSADKWARTILSWLCQVGWAVQSGVEKYGEQTLPLYTTRYEVDRVLQYSARSTVKYVPQEMLCSAHHPFAQIVQQRRAAVLRILSQKPYMAISDLTSAVQAQGLEADEETLAFDILNLRQAGIQISKEVSIYRLTDNIHLDTPPEQLPIKVQGRVADVEKQIERYVMAYEDILPSKLVDNLIRYGSGGAKTAAYFEDTVRALFSIMGYEAKCLGQGRGRVTDVIVKYRDPLYSKSYALMIDTKASNPYAFPAGDVRKMKEYIALHGKELMQDMIPNHAFLFASMAFKPPEGPLEEIAADTAVSGTTADVFSLMDFAAKVLKQEISIKDMYPHFTTNRQFVCP